MEGPFGVPLSYPDRRVRWLAYILIVTAVALLIHRGLLYAEFRGWIFYRHRPRIQFLGLLEELVEPRVEYVIEEETSQRTRADQAESGQGCKGPGSPVIGSRFSP
jgi:hypothetical protein